MCRASYLVTSIFMLIATHACGQNEFKKYSNDKYKFSFDLPTQWSINYSKEQAGFICTPLTDTEKSEYEGCFEGIIFRLEFFNSGLTTTLRSQGNYTRKGKYYYTTAGLNRQLKAKNLRGKNWVGIYHNNICGITCEEGFHAAAGQCQFIYFSNGQSTILIDTNGRELDDKILKRIISSFSFN